MSSGSPIVPIRIAHELLRKLDAEIKLINLRRREAPYNRSTFILAALKMKLDHVGRSRNRKSKRMNQVQHD